MKTIKEFIRLLVTCNKDGLCFMPNDMADECTEIACSVVENEYVDHLYSGNLSNKCNAQDEVIISILFEVAIKSAILEYLEKNHPQAWFKPVFMSKEEQRKMGLPVLGS